MSYLQCPHGVDLSGTRCFKCEEIGDPNWAPVSRNWAPVSRPLPPKPIKKKEPNMNVMPNVYNEMVEKMEDHVFECYFFTQMVSPLLFCLHENYYHIKNGKVVNLAFPNEETKETPLNVIIHGKDLGVFDPEKKYERKFYDINIKQFKKNRKART